MRARTRGTSLAVALIAIAALAGCDTNYYGDSGKAQTTTSTTTTEPAAPPVMAPGYDTGATSTTTTQQRTYSR